MMGKLWRKALCARVAYAAAAGLAALLCDGCGGDSKTPTTPTSPSAGADAVTSVMVTGMPPVVGAESQFTATAALSGGGTQNVTAQATWTSSNLTVATVNPAGVVMGVAAGEAIITASHQSASGTARVAVLQPACGAVAGMRN